MGSLTDHRPVFFLGKCKVYTSVAAGCWRVKPDPSKYENDVKFHWKGDAKKAWKAMLEYCKKPDIPKTWTPISKKESTKKGKK